MEGRGVELECDFKSESLNESRLAEITTSNGCVLLGHEGDGHSQFCGAYRSNLRINFVPDLPDTLLPEHLNSRKGKI